MQTYNSQTPKHQVFTTIPTIPTEFQKDLIDSENSIEMQLLDSGNSAVFI